MLLRRVIAHFRKQEWTAIAIDFVIVVIGVFVGIQVSNWNAARQMKAEQHSILVRLLAEAEEAVYFWRREIFYAEGALANQRRLLAALDAGAVEADGRAAVEDGLMRLSHYPSINPPRAVYDELIASGGLRLIADLETRKAVAAYVGRIDFVEGQLAQFRADSLPVKIRAFQGRAFSVYAPEKASLREFEYDFDALARDRQFVSDVVDLVRNQLQFQTYREAALKAATAMCEAAARAVGARCKVRTLDQAEIDAFQGVNK
jgi:hypothetical protein